MGSSSKVILVAATTLIAGVYGVSLKQAEGARMESALKHVKRVQNEKTEDAALRASLSAFVVDNNGARDKSAKHMKALGGGSFNYYINANRNFATLELTLTNDGVVKVIKSKLAKRIYGQVEQGPRKVHRGQWEVTSTHIAKK